MGFLDGTSERLLARSLNKILLASQDSRNSLVGVVGIINSE